MAGTGGASHHVLGAKCMPLFLLLPQDARLILTSLMNPQAHGCKVGR